MKQIRRGVFETNSSSTHSVTIDHSKGLSTNYLYVSEDGYVHAEFGEFGWEVWNYTDQETRLSYLLTMARCLNGCNESCYDDVTNEEDIKNFIETRDFDRINEVVAEYANCKGLWLDPSDGYIDHQSREDYRTLDDFLHEYNTDIKEFIFGAGVTLHTDNDNH